MAFCRKCGNQLAEGAAFCPACGAAAQMPAAQPWSAMPAADAPSGPVGGPGSPLPAELRRWNWGAFLLNWIWGLGNRVYIGLLALVPIVGWVMAFVLGSRGNEWAWNAKRWESVEAFRRTQRRWSVAGGLLIGGFAVLVVVSAIAIPMLTTTEPTQPQDQSLSGSAPGTSLTRVASPDGSLVLRIPAGWKSMKGLHDDAELQVGNDDANLYAVVIPDPRADLDMPLERFGDTTREKMLEGLEEGRTTAGPTHLTVNGNPAIRYEIRGTKDETRIVYLHTAVESQTYFTQVIAWTALSDYDSSRETLLALLNTFEAR